MNSSNVSLFDQNGRRIAYNLKNSVVEPDQNFYLKQPKKINYAERLQALSDLGLNPGITPEQFQNESERLLSLIQNENPIANILKSVHLPIVIPQMLISDLGETLDSLLKAVGESYRKTFPKRDFNNYREGTLGGEVSVIPGSRQDLLIGRMQEQSVVGIYFPNPLQGFSVNASREQIADLPENFILSGLDIIIAIIMYSDIIARDWHTPGLDLAAFQYRSASSSLFFRAYDAYADFSAHGNLGPAYGYDSGGLLFLR